MKIPTPKQVRYHYKKCRTLFEKLERALRDAHEAGVIQYDQTNYVLESPCPLVFDADRRLDKTTEKALANAMRWEIMR